MSKRQARTRGSLGGEVRSGRSSRLWREQETNSGADGDMVVVRIPSNSRT